MRDERSMNIRYGLEAVGDGLKTLGVAIAIALVMSSCMIAIAIRPETVQSDVGDKR